MHKPKNDKKDMKSKKEGKDPKAFGKFFDKKKGKKQMTKDQILKLKQILTETNNLKYMPQTTSSYVDTKNYIERLWEDLVASSPDE